MLWEDESLAFLEGYKLSVQIEILTGYSYKLIENLLNETQPITIEHATIIIVGLRIPVTESWVLIDDLGYSLNNFRSKFTLPYFKIINNKEERDDVAIKYLEGNNLSPKKFIKNQSKY